jgi:lipoate-protein ligase B
MHWESPSIYPSTSECRRKSSPGLPPEVYHGRLVVNRLGTIDYGKAYRLQKEIHQRRVEGTVGDTLLLLEHPPTITVGKAGNIENIIVPRPTLERMGISLYFVDRGGDVTYHGPGQLVGYPIMNLRERGGDLKRYVYELEEVMIRTLHDFSIHADRDPRHVGVWIGPNKIGAIGLSVRQGVTMHGFALNVNPRMEHFALIHACGLKKRRATSMEHILGFQPPLQEVTEKLLTHSSRVLGEPILETQDLVFSKP